MTATERREMKVVHSVINLPFENGKSAKFTRVGNGSCLVYIMGGLAPFYLKGLIVTGLADKVTLVVHDDPLWVHNKLTVVNEEIMKQVNLETIMQKEKLLIEALKKYFNCSKVSLFGFSALAALTSEYALRYPADVACLVETGAGLCKLDPTFQLTDETLRARSPSRYARFKKDQHHYEDVLTGKENPLPEANFFGAKGKHKRTLTPNSAYIEWVRSITSKLAYFDQSEEHQKNVIDHWSSSLTGQFVYQPMREHFFNCIFSQLDPLNLVNKLAEKKIPVLFIQGENDYITPLGEGVAEQLKTYESIELAMIPECGHMPYYEHPLRYAEIISGFLVQRTSPSTPSTTCSLPLRPTAKTFPLAPEGRDCFFSSVTTDDAQHSPKNSSTLSVDSNASFSQPTNADSFFSGSNFIISSSGTS